MGGQERAGRGFSLWVFISHCTKLRCLLPGFTSSSQIMGIHQRTRDKTVRWSWGGERWTEVRRERGIEHLSILLSACRGSLDVVSVGCPPFELGLPLLAIESLFSVRSGRL